MCTHLHLLPRHNKRWHLRHQYTNISGRSRRMRGCVLPMPSVSIAGRLAFSHIQNINVGQFRQNWPSDRQKYSTLGASPNPLPAALLLDPAGTSIQDPVIPYWQLLHSPLITCVYTFTARLFLVLHFCSHIFSVSLQTTAVTASFTTTFNVGGFVGAFYCRSTVRTCDWKSSNVRWPSISSDVQSFSEYFDETVTVFERDVQRAQSKPQYIGLSLVQLQCTRAHLSYFKPLICVLTTTFSVFYKLHIQLLKLSNAAYTFVMCK